MYLCNIRSKLNDFILHGNKYLNDYCDPHTVGFHEGRFHQVGPPPSPQLTMTLMEPTFYHHSSFNRWLMSHFLVFDQLAWTLIVHRSTQLISLTQCRCISCCWQLPWWKAVMVAIQWSFQIHIVMKNKVFVIFTQTLQRVLGCFRSSLAF